MSGVSAVYDQDVKTGGEERRCELGSGCEGSVGGHVTGQDVHVCYVVVGETCFYRGWCSRQSDDGVGGVTGKVLEPCVLDEGNALVFVSTVKRRRRQGNGALTPSPREAPTIA